MKKAGVIFLKKINKVLISEARDMAEKYYKEKKYLCSEAVLAAVNEVLDCGMPKEYIRLVSGFPVGMGGAGCTCVFTRETVGFAFRDSTKKGEFWWKLRHLKWIMLVLVWSFLIYLIVNPHHANTTFKRPLYKFILDIYYGTILLIPFIGHRNICRYACPWSATWAVLNKVGPYKIVADTNKCIDCGICERECDMGIPIQNLIHKTGMINTGECMGCERCVRKCPRNVLQIVDFRDKISSFNMTNNQRSVRVILGLTLAIIPFIFNNKTGLFVALIALYLFSSGLFGYSLLSCFSTKKNYLSKKAT